MNVHEYLCTEAGSRLDAFLSAENAEFSRSRIEMLIKSGNVTVNGKAVSKNYRLRAGIFMPLQEGFLFPLKSNVPTERRQ